MRIALCALSTMVAISAHAEEITLSDEISLDDLNNTRGGQHIELDLFHTTSDIDGLLADNVASNTVSGNNILSPGVFADSSGISNVIQNTGNNVLIQNSTVVNLTLK
ncbi:carbon storage regulator [Vibrio agarivorans]|uniref:carbon storage regulator n=2 Tax=Vibrio agarivorans TaxID=153622 RepID=UPI0025B3A2F7|nr:carbon storage regulator [Vibrio agarivorans]MDN3662434.1 carbon storage regulator [Vibrio agarivorans]